MSTVSVNSLLAKYKPQVEGVVAAKPSDAEKGRVTVGQVFIQPTKNMTNYSYCYWGFTDKLGKFITGFSMDNELALSMVAAGHLPKDCLLAFEAFAEKYVPMGKQVIKEPKPKK